MARIRRAVRRFRRGNHEFVWAAMLSSATEAASGGTYYPLVVASDWTSGESPQQATLMRIRGHLVVQSAGAAVGNATQWGGYICKTDVDDTTSQGPFANAGELVDQDILATYFWSTRMQASGGDGVFTQKQFVIDVKSRRKLKLESEIRLVTENASSSSNSVITYVLTRALLRIG